MSDREEINKQDFELVLKFAGEDVAQRVIYGGDPIRPVLREAMKRIMDLEKRERQLALLPEEFIEAWHNNEMKNLFKCEGDGTG